MRWVAGGASYPAPAPGNSLFYSRATMRRAAHGLLTRAVCASAAAALLAIPVSAFDSKGHLVIEALAYRTLIEGHGDVPPQPDALRDLFNDGDLAPPLCFGWDGNPPGFC